MKSRDIILRGMSCRVGNGQNILFWTHNWVFPYRLFYLVPNIDSENCNWDLKVSDFIENTRKLFEVFNYEVVKKICNIPIPIQETKDMFIWGPTMNSKFSVKFAPWIQKGTLVQTIRHKLINKMLKLNIPPKVKMFAWYSFVRDFKQEKY